MFPHAASGHRPGSNGQSTQRPPSRGVAGGGLREERSRAKFEKLEALYDFPEVIKSREALKDKVLKNPQGPTSRKHAEFQKPQGEMVKDWMLAERQRADQLAEERWTAKYVEWHNNNIAQPGGISVLSSAFKGDEGGSAPATVLSLDPNDEEVVALLKQTESYHLEATQWSNKREQLERDIVRLQEELQAEQPRKAHVEKLLSATVDDRDAWAASASRHEDMRKRFVSEQHHTSSLVSELHGQLATIGNTLQVESRNLEPQPDADEEQKREEAARKIQARARGRAGRRRAAAKRKMRR